jgi:hypothetical protein
MTDGKLLWTSPSVGTGYENVEGTWIFGGSSYAGNSEPGVAADGKLYMSTQTNYRGEPMARYNTLFCINATTGQFLWNITGAIATTAVADGYLLGNNGDNGILYCFGKGPTATTVEAPMTQIQLGTKVLIQGTVTDQSPAQPGTPAVSDDSMTTQMNYYMQNNATLVNNPPTPTGVPVQLTAIDPNGNFQNLGTVTTDSAGTYAIAWNPPVPGVYTITATFAGTNSYWASSAVTHIFAASSTSASAAPATTAAPTSAVTPTQTNSPSPNTAVQPPASGMPITTYMAIGAAVIIIVATATVLVLRKRK